MMVGFGVPSSVRALSVDCAFPCFVARISLTIFSAVDTNAMQSRHTATRPEDSRILYDLSQICHLR